MAMEKINTLSLGEKLVVGGGVLMIIAVLFFDWYHVSVGGFGGGTSGTSAPGGIWGLLILLISIVLAGAVIAPKLGNMKMPALPTGMTWGKVFGYGAAAIVVLMLLKAWRINNVPIGGFGIGFWIGVIAAVAIAYGGWLLYKEESGGM
jgi:hypothetical protein